jgi:hypothetical protein
MKNIFKNVAVAILTLLLVPFVLYVVVSAIRFTSFYISIARMDTNACTQYYEGESKGILWERSEWHHYVDFKVDIYAPREQWKLVNAPLPTTLWSYTSPSPNVIRASYRWPSSWQDPFSVSSWRICLLGS